MPGLEPSLGCSCEATSANNSIQHKEQLGGGGGEVRGGESKKRGDQDRFF